MVASLRYRHSSIGRARAFRKSMTDGEQKLWSRLRGKQLEYYFRRQTPIGKYIVDFACLKEKLVVEIDGSQHFTMTGKEHDRIRDHFLKEQGFRVLRFDSVEVLNNTDGIVDAIYEYLKNPLSSPMRGTVLRKSQIATAIKRSITAFAMCLKNGLENSQALIFI
jgi:very-short-patch-repair endonuclease